MTSPAAPFAAAMMECFGLRRVLTGALLTVATGALLTLLMSQPWHLILFWGIVVGLGTGSMATVLAATVANRWFVRRRGLVMGVLTAASATGQLVFLPVMAWLAGGLHRGRERHARCGSARARLPPQPTGGS